MLIQEDVQGRACGMGKKQVQKNSLDIAFDSAIDFELDFDLDDFDLTLGEENEDEGGFKTRIMRPKMNVKNVSHKVVYRNAEKLAEKIDLTEGARTFAWVSGDFIFGDLLEALVMKKRISPKKIYICSLGMSQDNIDSLRNIIEWTGLGAANHPAFGLLLLTRERAPYPVSVQGA